MKIIYSPLVLGRKGVVGFIRNHEPEVIFGEPSQAINSPDSLDGGDNDGRQR